MELFFWCTGGYGNKNSVLQYDRNDINIEPTHVEPMINSRFGHACTTFYSPAHDGRSVLIVAGGDVDLDKQTVTAEVWDYTNEGSTWKESKLVSTIFLLIVSSKK